MSVRAVDTVRGIETVLSVDKADNETYVVLKCATQISYTSDKETLEAACYGGTEMLMSGADAVKSFSLTGQVKEYASVDQANNVSYYDLLLWHEAGTLKKFKYARPHVGDTVQEFEGFVTALGESGDPKGLQTYTATITPRKKGTISKLV